MEFQNQPFQDLKERVEVLEGIVDALQAHLFALSGSRVRFSTPEPQTVLQEQDDAEGESILTTVEKTPETDATRS